MNSPTHLLHTKRMLVVRRSVLPRGRLTDAFSRLATETYLGKSLRLNSPKFWALRWRHEQLNERYRRTKTPQTGLKRAKMSLRILPKLTPFCNDE
ncbi:hypothetical protein ACXYMW_14625 [Roseivivax sp. CAU 1761]